MAAKDRIALINTQLESAAKAIERAANALNVREQPDPERDAQWQAYVNAAAIVRGFKL